jgi:hypothetical protein
MITTVVTARSGSNKPNSAGMAQGWPRINSLPQSNELGSRRAKAFPCAGGGCPANPAPIEISLTLIDLGAIAGLFLTTAFFFPALAWLLLLP